MKALYRERVRRSFGIFDERQILKLHDSKIAVAGLGLGGAVFLNLVRLGIEKFHIADPDVFERTNINRQRVAKESTLNQRKDQSTCDEALDINPDVKIRCFEEGVKTHNLDSFLQDIDCVVDIVDVFALPEKLALHHRARQLNIPVVSCATLGFSGSVVVFDENTPSFSDLTGMRSEDNFIDNLIKFIQFICPEVPSYMKEQMIRALDRSTHIPFVVPGCEISAALGAAEVVKCLLGIGNRILAPKGIFCDSYRSEILHFTADFRARDFDLEIGKKAA